MVEQIDRLDRRNVRRCVVSATFAVAILLACALQWRLAAPVDAEGTPAASPVATAQPAPGDNANGPLQVTVGLYVLEIHELDQQASTYKADFYLWMRWRGAFDNVDDAGEGNFDGFHEGRVRRTEVRGQRTCERDTPIQ